MVKALAVAAFAIFLLVYPTASAHAVSDGKAFVCKYVGTPGVDERLQTGQNPIDVSVNAIGEDPVVVGSYFNDAQGRSFVLALDTGQDEPDVSACPGYVPPTTTTENSTTTSSPGATTTTAPGETTTTVTVPCVEDCPTTTTEAQQSTTTRPGETTTTDSTPVTISGQTTTTEPLVTTAPTTSRPATGFFARALPFTGAPLGGLTVVGATSAGLGLAFHRRQRRGG